MTDPVDPTAARDLPPRRRDEEMEWHDVVSDECSHCGCSYDRAADDPWIVWEPGRAWDERCSDLACPCHEDPIVGARRN